MVAQEIVDTERGYVTSLGVLMEVFMAPLCEHSTTGRSLLPASAMAMSAVAASAAPSSDTTATGAADSTGAVAAHRTVTPPDIDAATITAIFSNVATLCVLNQKFLADLTERLRRWSSLPPGDQCLGDIFIQIGPFLKMYKMVLYWSHSLIV